MKSVLLVVHPTRPAAAKFGNLLAAKFISEKYQVFANFPDLISGSKEIESVEAIAAADKEEAFRNDRRSNFFMGFVLLRERYVNFLYQEIHINWA